VPLKHSTIHGEGKTYRRARQVCTIKIHLTIVVFKHTGRMGRTFCEYGETTLHN